MSPSPSPSSGKLAGFILLGVAALALVVGLVTAFGGDSQDRAGGPVSGAGSSSPGGQGSGPGQPGASGSGQGQQPGGGNGQGGNGQGNGQGGNGQGNGNGQGGNGQGGDGANQPSTSYPRGSTTKVIPPPPAGGGEANGGRSGGTAQGVAATKLAPVRVYNNSTIKGLAHEAANDFRAAGFKVVGVGNYSQGTISSSTVYYRPGTGEQATATSLANRFGMRVEQRFPGISKSSPGVIVIVTNNYSR